MVSAKSRLRQLWPLIFLITLTAGAVFFIAFGVGILPAGCVGSLTVEAGSELPAASAFLTQADGNAYYLTCPTDQDLTVPGEYAVTIHGSWRNFSATLCVVDTTPPTGTAQDLTVYQFEMPEAADFIVEMQDISPITVSYGAQPDETDSEPQAVALLLTDESGNITELTAQLTVIIDDEAPVISGVDDITVYTGGTVAYRSGVTVTDNLDEDVTLTVDSSAVDLSTPGEYQVVYSAADFFGNETTVTATVTVYEMQDSYVELDVIYEAVDKVLATFLTDDMTDREKVNAIYNWITSHCYYRITADSNWLQSAYHMLTVRSGDCYDYFALCKLMLERQNIPNIDVVKIPNWSGDTNHYWSLVSVDGGETYYHVDTTPRESYIRVCLVTDQYLDNYSLHAYNRDRSLYPATPEE